MTFCEAEGKRLVEGKGYQFSRFIQENPVILCDEQE